MNVVTFGRLFKIYSLDFGFRYDNMHTFPGFLTFSLNSLIIQENNETNNHISEAKVYSTLWFGVGSAPDM